jgi:hypothetical protein
MALNIQQSVLSELADFIVSQPTLEAIITYSLPESLEQRAHELLEKNREESLTRDEREEMEHILAMEDMITLAKAKARLKLMGKA